MMKYRLFFLVILLLNIATIQAQSPNCRNIELYERYSKEGQKLVAKGEYVEALKFYESAKDMCAEKAALVDSLIVRMIDDINAQRAKAQQTLATVNAEKERAKAAQESAVKLLQEIGGEQDNYYEYFYDLGKSDYDLGEYEESIKNLILASQCFDKPDTVDLGGLISKLEQCQVSQNKAYALIKAQKYEEAEAQIAIAYEINPRIRRTILIANALNPVKYGLTKVKGGTFMMGGKEYKNEKPIHEVSLDDFSIGRYEVTNLAYAIFLNRYGSAKVKEGAYKKEEMIYIHKWGVSKNSNGIWEVSSKDYDFHPVVYVTWYGANEFCKYYGGRLSTEAEWEYSARGGARSKGFEYAGAKYLTEVAWYGTNSDNETHAVGQKQANELGLYDMSGNVWEWCSDWYAGNYYRNSPRENPAGARDGAYRVLRGGGWYIRAEDCRVANRSYGSPEVQDNSLGFRFVF